MTWLRLVDVRRRWLRTAGTGGLVIVLALDPGAALAGGTRSGPPTADDTAAPAGMPHGPSVRGSRSGPAAAGSSPTDGPSIMALEAAAHAGDRIALPPGGRVTRGFTPDPEDPWRVDGAAPRSLPAGSATGVQMAASPQGSVWADGSTPGGSAAGASWDGATDESGYDAPVDGPAGHASAIAAVPAGASLSPDDPLSPPAATGLRRQVFGFLPYWKVGDSTTVLNDDLLSTIAYFGVGVDKNGNLLKKNLDGTTTVGWAGWTSSKLTSVINTAHKKHTRVVLTIQAFAWTSTQAARQATLLDSSTARLNLARQAAAAVRNRGADGVNLDFEPLVPGRADEFTAFVRTLRAELNRLASGYQLTFDTTGSIGNYPIEAATASGGADAIFIMGYDYRTASATYAGSVDPLNGPTYDLTDTAIAYLSRVPANKVILGVPYYGRAWSTGSDALHARTQTGTKYGASASVTYVNAVDVAAKHGRRYDTLEQAPWVAYQRKNCTATYGCVTTWRELYYDDAQSLRARYDLINRYGLRGAGIWALGYDGTRTELYKALADKFLHDTTPPVAGIKVLPTRVGDEGFRVSWTAFDLSSIRGYDVQRSTDGGAWTGWLAGTTATSAIYLGLDGHAYAFRVRARDSAGNVSPWNVAALADTTPSLAAGGFAVVAPDTLNVRNRPDTSASTVFQLSAGDVVALTDGPVSADGYTWFQITEPIHEWAPTAPVRSGNWVAAKSSSSTYLKARTPPNSTIVDAGISGLSFGSEGPASLGTSADALAARSFSPNGDGSEDRLTMRWRNNLALDSLVVRVFHTDASLVGSRAVPGLDSGSHAWAWDGAIGGSRLADGRYMVQLVGKAGTRTYSSPSASPVTAEQVARYGVVIDTVPPAFSTAAITSRVISPNADGRFDTIGISATTSGGASRWRFTSAHLGASGPGSPLRMILGAGSSPRVSWDGRTDGGAVPADGAYRLALQAFDPAGNAATRTWDVVLDTTSPSATAAATPVSFSPNGDGAADTTLIGWSASEPTTALVRIYHGTTRVRTFTVSASARTGSVRWNGKSSGGDLVADGSYIARVSLTDRAGNRAVFSAPMTIDRTAGWLRWSPNSFYPQDGDSLSRTSKVTFRLTRTATTTLRIVDPAGNVVRTAWTNRTVGAGTVGWTWNGRNATRDFVAPGRYTAVLTAASRLGTTILRRPIVVDAFVATLPTTVSPGQILIVRFRTVERLSTRPVVTFSQPGRAAISKTATLVSTGHYRVAFTVGSGSPGVAGIVISARDSAGGRNRSVRYVTVE